MINTLAKFLILSLVLIIFGLPSLKVDAAVLQLPPNNLGLVGYWPFNENTGTQAGDFSGNNNHGTLINSPTWTTGKRAGAVHFSGGGVGGARITMNDGTASSRLNFTGSFSISAWVYADSWPTSGSNHVTVISRYTGDNGYELRNENGNMCFYVVLNGAWVCGGSYALSTGRWYHLVGVYDGSTAKLYANGVNVGTNQPASAPGSSSQAFTIGKRSEQDEYSWIGTIDEVRAYNRALSATEVATLYRSGQVTRKQVSNSGLVGYWPMNEGTSTIAGDFSGNNNHGTLTTMDPTTDWVNGKRGKALDFDGSNDYVDASSIASSGMTANAFTMSGWAKPSSNSNMEIAHLGKLTR